MNKEINGPMSPDIELESFLRTYIQAKRIFENPVCKQVFRNLQGTNNDLFERLEKECDQAEKEAEKVASSLL